MPLKTKSLKRQDHSSSYEFMNGLSAKIIMNPRDAMVFVEVNKLPEKEENINSDLAEFYAFVTKEVGGKIIFTLSPSLLDQFPDERKDLIRNIIDGIFKPVEAPLRYISKDAMHAAFLNGTSKQHVNTQLEKFTTSEYRLIFSNELLTRVAELSEFKIKHASFVDDIKIKRGQYSEIAELEKIKNPFVRHLAVTNNNGEIIACSMYVLYANMAYVADFIVHNNLRTANPTTPTGFGKALAIKTYEDMMRVQPTTAGITFVGGGHGSLGIGARLFGEEGFKSITLNVKENASAPRDLGIYTCFTGAGLELLKAANRNPNITDPKEISALDDKSMIEIALTQWKESKQPNLTATQPLPQTPTPAQPTLTGVTSVSMFPPPSSATVSGKSENNLPEKKL
jgi:hypothetical protein